MGQTESCFDTEEEDKNASFHLISPSTDSQSLDYSNGSIAYSSSMAASKNTIHDKNPITSSGSAKEDIEKIVRFSESKHPRGQDYGHTKPAKNVSDEIGRDGLSSSEDSTHWLERLLQRDDDNSKLNSPSFTYLEMETRGSTEVASQMGSLSNKSTNVYRHRLSFFPRRNRRAKKEEVESILGNSFSTQTNDLAGLKDIRSKFVIKSPQEIQLVLSYRLRKKNLKDECLDPQVICGRQIYIVRSLDFEEQDTEGKRDKYRALGINKLDPLRHNFSHDGISVGKLSTNRISHKKAKKTKSFREDPIPKSQRIASTLFTPDAVLQTKVNPVNEIVCISKSHEIYVCDIGLTSTQCQSIVDAAERCSQGMYSSYTYAKQTLGCRDHDELGIACEHAVMKACTTIRQHIDKERNVADTLVETDEKDQRVLILDQREPHVVKYDVSRKDRTKLEMHTDKSVWTFIIALSQGEGYDYDAGGTYFENIDSTVHMERGHAIIFPGKLRHRGQKIVGGSRFLLVGFLVEKKNDNESVVTTRNATIGAIQK